MNTNPTYTQTHKIGQEILVDLAHTVGQESAIEANGSSLFAVRVTSSALVFSPNKAGEAQEAPGFARVLGTGPVAGYEVLYTTGSVVNSTPAVIHAEGLVAFAGGVR